MSTTSQVQTGKTLEVENSLLIQNHDFKSQKAFKPEKMTLLQLERAAKKQREQEEQVVNVVEAIEASPLDAAYALWLCKISKHRRNDSLSRPKKRAKRRAIRST